MRTQQQRDAEAIRVIKELRAMTGWQGDQDYKHTELSGVRLLEEFANKFTPPNSSPAATEGGELPLCDYDLNCISAAIFRAFYNETPPYGSKHSQRAINEIIQKAFAEAQVNPNRPV